MVTRAKVRGGNCICGIRIVVLVVILFFLGGPSPTFAFPYFYLGRYLDEDGSTNEDHDWWPQVATDGEGNWVVVWCSCYCPYGCYENSDGDIYVSRSTNNGITWTSPVFLASNAETDSGDDEYPHIAADSSGNFVVAWGSDENLEGGVGTDWDIFFCRSSDGGRTWSDPATLNTNASSDLGGDGKPKIATDDFGTWLVVWTSSENLGGTIGTDFDLFAARSTDAGVTWTDPIVVNSRAGSDSGGDYEPQIATDGWGDWGNWVVIWTSYSSTGSLGSDEDILCARSSDSGSTWSASSPVNSDAYADNTGVFTDDFEPAIATDGAGNWVAAWTSFEWACGNTAAMHSARSANAGITWSTAHLLEDTPGHAFHPQVLPNGSGCFALVWDTSSEEKIYCSMTQDCGVSWTHPAYVDPGAVYMEFADEAPSFATDGNGNWVGVWAHRVDWISPYHWEIFVIANNTVPNSGVEDGGWEIYR